MCRLRIYSENRIWAALGAEMSFFLKLPIFTNIEFTILGAGGAILDFFAILFFINVCSHLIYPMRIGFSSGIYIADFIDLAPYRGTRSPNMVH